MLAIPVATTHRSVADSSSAAWTNGSRPTASGSQIADQPIVSSSAATSQARLAGSWSSTAVHRPTRPRRAGTAGA